MLTVHHLNQSRSQRVLWALEELQLPYQIVRYQREKTMLVPAALKIHPLGKSPVLEDNGYVLAESGRSSVFAGNTGQRRVVEAAGN